MSSSGGFRVLRLVKPFLNFLPEVKQAERKVPFREKALYTGVSLFVFLVCSQLPLYGIHAASGADPLYWARVIMASNRGTCMELGISPIVTSSLVMQLLTGSKIIELDHNVKEDRQLLAGAQKLLGVLITIGEAVAYVVSGMYGDVRELGSINAILIIAQASPLLAAGLARAAFHRRALTRHAAVYGGHHRDLPGRDAAARLGPGLGHLALHRHQHVRADCVEGAIAHHHHHGARDGV